MKKFTTGFAAQISAIFLFSTLFCNQSLAVNRVVSSVENLDIDISEESSTSTIAIESGGILNANITMGNSSQSTILNGGTLNGNVSGSGKINVSLDSNLNGSINISSTISIASGATLSVNGGDIFVSIRGAADNSGAVKFNADNTLLASVGTSSTTLELIELANNVVLNTSDKTINALAIKIGDGATLNYGGGDIVGSVEGTGKFVFSASDTTNFDIIENVSGERLSEIKINNGTTVNLGENITADTINIGEGLNGSLKSNGNSISANNINIFTGATLDLDINSAILGEINGAVAGVGKVQFSNSQFGYTQNQSLGAVNKLAEILISNETAIILDSAALNADIISVGEGGTTGIIAPVLTQNSGTVGVDDNSQIKLNTNAVFNYNGGIINGAIRGTSNGKGNFNINSNYTNNLKIGTSGSLANLNIANNKTLTANADIAADNISLAGALNLGSSAKAITGNLTTSGSSATIDLGSAGHTISGNFITSNNDILKLNAVDNSNIGNLTVAGSSVIANGLSLEITFNANDGYLSNGTNFAIVSSGSGTINAVNDGNIDINNSGSNQSGLLTFHSIKSGNNLVLSVDRKGAETFSDSKFVSKIYNNIDQIGANATAELRDLQKIIDSNILDNKTKESALKSAIPQNNQDLNNSSFSSANSSVSITNQRLQNVLLNSNNSISNNFFNLKNFSNFFGKENISNLNKLNFDDDIFDSQSIWLQGFGTSAAQENVGDNFGYNYKNQGLIIGVDQEIAENLRLGISSSFATANSKSNSGNKKETDIDSYQFNLYGGYNFSPYFFSGILGVAINKYNSIRSMPELGQQAKAGYGGETYIVKFETGMIKELNYDFKITPKFSLTAARNQIDTYQETGSGTLNLSVSNEHSNFLEGRVGSDFSYQGLQIFKPKIKLSFGYDFLASDQSSTNHFQGQNSSFQIKNSNIDKASLKYGFGFDIYEEDGFLLVVDYDVEVKSSYKSKTGSIYLRYDF